MKSLVALSISIGVLGGIAAALCLGPLAGKVLIWAVFIAWGCFFCNWWRWKGITKNYYLHPSRCNSCLAYITNYTRHSISRRTVFANLGRNRYCCTGHNNVLVSTY